MLEVKDFTKIYKLTQKQRKEMRTDEHNKVAANHISFQAKKGEAKRQPCAALPHS